MVERERRALVLGLDEEREDVVRAFVGGHRGACLELLAEVGEDLADPLGRDRGVLDALLQDAHRPVGEAGLVRQRDPEHRGDHPHRDVAGVRQGGVGGSVGGELVEQVVGDALR